jgi:hypothetical protein
MGALDEAHAWPEDIAAVVQGLVKNVIVGM